MWCRRLRAEKDRRGIPAAEFAMALGVNARTMEQWLQGRALPSTRSMVALMRRAPKLCPTPEEIAASWGNTRLCRARALTAGV